MTARRARLGGRRGLLLRETVWRTAAGLEVDEAEAGWLTRRRIAWEDVVLVTCHRRHRALVLLALGGSMLLSALVAALARHWGPLLALGLLLPLLLLELALGVHVVTVFGRGVRARLEFEYRPARAQGVMRELWSAARQRQAALVTGASRTA